MRAQERIAVLLLAAASVGLLSAAGSGGGVAISWHTIDGGGGDSIGGGYELSGTIGQPEGVAMSAGTLVLLGGYWSGASGRTRGMLGDIDGNGAVDAADLAILLGAWGASGPGDLDGDGMVGAPDLAILLGAWTG